jgi:hypothetical protein
MDIIVQGQMPTPTITILTEVPHIQTDTATTNLITQDALIPQAGIHLAIMTLTIILGVITTTGINYINYFG